MATHRQNSHSGPLLLDCPDEEQEGEMGPSDTSTMDLTSTNTLANTRRESGNRERPGYRESRDHGTEHPMDTLALGNVAEQLWGQIKSFDLPERVKKPDYCFKGFSEAIR